MVGFSFSDRPPVIRDYDRGGDLRKKLRLIGDSPCSAERAEADTDKKSGCVDTATESRCVDIQHGGRGCRPALVEKEVPVGLWVGLLDP